MNHIKRKILLLISLILLSTIIIWIYKSASSYNRVEIANPETVDGAIQVVATTSLLECAVKDIGGQYVKVKRLVAPGNCPGHYDISPEDLRVISKSLIIFCHGYE